MTDQPLPRVAFAGTPAFAVPGLEALIASNVDVVAVYTQPDRRAGRGKKVRACAVKERAMQAGLPVHQPNRMLDVIDDMQRDSLDLLVVIAFGQLLPKAVLNVPRAGCINVHASLLPRWRGAAPIARAIAAGDQQTGVCLMQMTQGLDEGPVLARIRTPITTTHTAARLHDELSLAGGELLKQHLHGLLNGELSGVAQDETLTTYAHKLTKEEAQIDWSQSAHQIDCQVRGFNPYPVAATSLADTVLRIWQIEIENDSSDALPGTVLDSDAREVRVATGTHTVRLVELQRPGGRRQFETDFLNGFSFPVGVQLGVGT